MRKRDKTILKKLRADSRIKLSQIAVDMNIPSQAVQDGFRRVSRAITKHTALIDFKQLGNPHWVHIPIKADSEGMKPFLLSNRSVNSIYKMSDGFYVEGVFVNTNELYTFLEQVEDLGGSYNLHHIIDDVVREKFMCENQKA